MSVDLNVVKNLELNTDNKILSTHNLIPLNKELEELFNQYKFNRNLQNSRVLHLKNGKLNSLTVNMIISNLGEEKCKQGLINLEKNLSSMVVTSYQLCSLINKSSNYEV